MTFLIENWFYIVILALFVGLHLFGFGCGHSRSHGPPHRHESGKGLLAKPDNRGR